MSVEDIKYDEANALKEQGDLEGAVTKFLEIVESDPNHSLTHSALGIYLQKLGRNEEAIKHAKRVTELEPNDPFSFTQLSVVCQRCGLIPEAEEAMARANQLQHSGGCGSGGVEVVRASGRDVGYTITAPELFRHKPHTDNRQLTDNK